MKWWSKCISMIIVIAKTASRNVALKSGKLAESVFTSQADILTRQLVPEDSSTDDNEAKRFSSKTWVIVVKILLKGPLLQDVALEDDRPKAFYTLIL